jgi:hypothetical protein
MGFEVHTKPNSKKSPWLKGTPLSRRSYADAVREHNKQYAGLCKNHTRLCEMFDLLMYMPDDFIGYLRLNAVKLGINEQGLMANVAHTVDTFLGGELEEFFTRWRRNTIEFAIGLAGFDLMNSSGKKMALYERKQVTADWEQHCAEHHYFTDFSLLLDQAEANGIIYLIDHTTFSYK